MIRSNDGNAYWPFPASLGNAVTRRSHDLPEDLGSFLNMSKVITTNRRQSGHD